jgi:hypothetical protein
VYFGFVDNEPQEEIRKKWKRKSESDDDQNNPDEGLNQHISKIQAADQFVFLHLPAPLRPTKVRRFVERRAVPMISNDTSR